MRNKRLQTIADLIQEDCILADIGTDHAYLPCALIQSGKALKCYACDIAEGPLQSAQATIEQAQLKERITTILCPGLRDVPADADAAVIAGMGWQTARLILEDDFDKLKQFKQFLIQVNRNVPELRKWLMLHGLAITLEKVVYDRLFYVIIGFDPQSRKAYTLTDEELLFGPLLMRNPDEECRAYYRSIVKKNEEILQRIDAAGEKAAALRWQNEVLNQIESRLKRA